MECLEHADWLECLERCDWSECMDWESADRLDFTVHTVSMDSECLNMEKDDWLPADPDPDPDSGQVLVEKSERREICD